LIASAAVGKRFCGKGFGVWVRIECWGPSTPQLAKCASCFAQDDGNGNGKGGNGNGNGKGGGNGRKQIPTG